MPQLDSKLNSEIQTLGKEIFDRMGQQKVSIFNKDWWYGNIMDWSMKNESFKIQMFRFVDVLPYLNSGSEVARHLKEYFADGGDELPSVFNFGVGIGSLAPGFMAGAVRKNVTQMAKMFITGESPKEALPILKKQRKNKIGFTIDLLGEATLSEKEAMDYHGRYIELISWLANEQWQQDPLLDSDDLGSLPVINVSVKISAIYSQINVNAWEQSKQHVKDRLRPIFDLAMEKEIFINIDMESYDVKQLTLDIFEEMLAEKKYAKYPHWGIVIQAYLRDSKQDCQKLIAIAKKRKIPFTVRLVKGAYWDQEVVHAKQNGWPVPVYTDKKESDANYEDCTRILLDAHPKIKLAIGSHNVRSISHAMTYAKKLGLDKQAIEIQMLFGMADPIKGSLVEMGYRVREYATVGELIPGMAYLVRRLLENTSNESFLRSKFVDGVSAEKLLEDPSIDLQWTSAEHLTPEPLFYNEPVLDFTEIEAREKTQKAVNQLEKSFPIQVPLCIDGKPIKSDEIITRESPNNTKLIIGKIHMANTTHAQQAVEAAKAAFKGWSETDAKIRASHVDKLADLMLRDRHQLMAVQIHEVGKPFAEADADITEAIDFCRYYARDMRSLNIQKRVGHAPGEVTNYFYLARGVAAVIAPWNFPLAILTGMTAAAAVTGNTVIMKPAEQSSTMAHFLMKLVQEAGFPKGVIQMLPGRGEVVGKYLVDHKDVATICFTGSKQVGLEIIKSAANVQAGQQRVKKCITEMGGKNAIIIDNDADLDEAVKGVVYSAFGFQGQKCSACSRVLVHKEIYDRFIGRLHEATRSIKVTPSTDPECYVGPVVDLEAKTKILNIIESAKNDSKLLFSADTPDEGHFVGPTIFTEVKRDSLVAVEEIFGPVLAVIKVESIDEALEVAMDSEYALTGGVFSRSPANLEKVREKYLVGNLYINRGCTGALVDRHPFGGFKMSGVGCKTGGPDYLKQFMDPRCVIENTMRRGFTPDMEEI